MKSVYELKKFKNSKHPDLIDALKLYTDNTEPAFRTDTKEIMHCLDNWNNDYEDKFYVVGFYYNGILIGFSELAYFVQEKFVIVDYMVIDKNYRGTHTFYQFLNDIKEFLRGENLEYNYVVAEVGCYSEGLEPPEAARSLVRLLKMSHFGVVKCRYYVPRVGIYDFESEMGAIMMIYSQNESKQIKKETFFQIVNAIYHKYYQRWHNLFVDEKEKKKYDEEISELKLKMEKQLSKKQSIEINGMNNLFPINFEPESPLKGKRLIRIVVALVAFIGTFVAVYFIFPHLKASNSEYSLDDLKTILSISGVVTVIIYILLFANKSVSSIVDKLLGKLLG